MMYYLLDSSLNVIAEYSRSIGDYILPYTGTYYIRVCDIINNSINFRVNKNGTSTTSVITFIYIASSSYMYPWAFIFNNIDNAFYLSDGSSIAKILNNIETTIVNDLPSIGGIAFDTNNNLYCCDGGSTGKIYRVISGVLTQVADTGGKWCSGIIFYSDGNFYITVINQSSYLEIWQLTTTGTLTLKYTSEVICNTAYCLAYNGVVGDWIYFTLNSQIRRYKPSTNTVEVVVGTQTPPNYQNDVVGTIDATILNNDLYSLCVDSNGVIYVLTSWTNLISIDLVNNISKIINNDDDIAMIASSGTNLYVYNTRYRQIQKAIFI